MQKPQKRLGRGLSSLISVTDLPSATSDESAPATASHAPSTVPLDQIQPNRYQPRKDFSSADLEELTASIRQTGVIQPILLRQLDQQHYELIAGERRWRASQLAGLQDIPAIIKDVSDEQMLELALVENIFREDLNAIDRALAYRRYCDEFRLSAEDVASRLGEDRTTVTNYLRLLDLPQEVKTWVAEGKLAMGHARALLTLKSPTEILQAAKRTINLALSVRAVEKMVRDRQAAREYASKPSITTNKRPQIRNLEQTFGQALSTKVEINESRRKGSGKIIIHYYQLEDFDRIAEKLGVELE